MQGQKKILGKLLIKLEISIVTIFFYYTSIIFVWNVIEFLGKNVLKTFILCCKTQNAKVL